MNTYYTTFLYAGIIATAFIVAYIAESREVLEFALFLAFILPFIITFFALVLTC